MYVEIHSDDKDAGNKVLENISCMLEEKSVDEKCVFVSDGESDLLRMKDFRHFGSRICQHDYRQNKKAG